ncbi:MAG: hypothetical protein PHU49_02035 [Syntrophorhabdaceae bacterium]|nr:hypothetical protein [Syntrophorhabdaceae bacterium]MDD5242772.1 hypothetical protein [Syntrophorhabdaceae bacterium]
MEVASSMRDLTEHILTSYNVRTKALGDLVSDTRKTLSDFTEERKNMGQEQNKHLSDFKNGLAASVDDMLNGFRKNRKTMGDEQTNYLEGFANDLTKNTSGMLNRLLKGRRQMSDKQVKNLGDFVNSLTRDTSAMMNGFKKTHGEMSAGLKDTLAANLKSIRIYTRDKLKEFEKSHGRMSDSLKKGLTRYVNDLAKDVSRLLHGYDTDMKEAGKSWDRMSSKLSGSRMKTTAPSVEIVEKTSTVQEAIEKKGLKQKKAMPEVEIEGRVLEYINKHPEGVKVGNMEMAFGLPRMKLGMKAKKLLERGRVRKEANLYYPLEAFQSSRLRVHGSRFSKEKH